MALQVTDHSLVQIRLPKNNSYQTNPDVFSFEYSAAIYRNAMFTSDEAYIKIPITFSSINVTPHKLSCFGSDGTCIEELTGTWDAAA